MQRNKDGVQNLFSQFGRFNLLLLLSVTLLSAGSFENFKRVQSASFSKYKDERDNAFNDYLKAEWQEYKAYITAPLYKEPKPKSITPLQEKKAPNVGPIVQIRVPKAKQLPKKETIKQTQKKDVNFDFFGTSVGFSIDKKIYHAKFYPENQAGIANFFSMLASSRYDTTLSEIKSCKKNLALNDWGVNLLVSKLAQTLYNDRNEANIYAWFLLSKLGYSVKIALTDNNDIFLLHYSKEIIYATPRYKFSGRYYYMILQYNKKDIGNIYTYEQDYPDADKALDFTMEKLPLLREQSQTRELAFKEYGKEYRTSFSYNKNIIDFMNSYPQVDYKVYFNAPMEITTYRDIAKDIKRYTDGKKISEAMNIVLRFVQKAFVYERDEEQFGHEKVMFAEETLVNKASDCEDRAVLFAYLIKKLFGVRVVGVKYSDHMSTALYIPMRGDSVKVGSRRYVMADPTYINANIGQEIPKYRNIQPESFIRLKSE
ncbi:hypothetical protein [Sulfurimonas paralvinellae]|uniref:Transglutaminase-like domain-containing protein n=1 Tax=Sulfurimonas paralvinellae TaxID=317658 RepID=A0A7M1B8J2_9BACT|nr:hypothetical protein [Sulfurimonas paralvinellae]QOP46040.1 hypothetical protein FM071_06910 [Sulfurimonas paralvinellae]